ncbi:MAG: SDR family NAD(P)-dependent oxidoreductase [Candidatus Kapaibacteriales bacterium]
MVNEEQNIKYAIVTGATAGIGWAIAHKLAKKGFGIIACGRRSERLNQLKAEVENIGSKCVTLSFDISARTEIENALSSLDSSIKTNVEILINNAGNAHGLSDIDEYDIDDIEMMVGINVFGLMLMTRLVSSWLVQNGRGTIVNISSVSGTDCYRGGAVYCATKAAVDSFTKGTRIDLADKGVRVCSVAPGAVNTEFSSVRFKGDKTRAEKVYEGFQPLTADDIADAVDSVISAPDNTVWGELLVLPKSQPAGHIIHKKDT